MGHMASRITSLTIVYSTVYSDADQRKHQSTASLAFVGGIHRWLVNSTHKGSVTWKMFPFDDVNDVQNDSDESSMRRHDMETFSPLLALCEGNPPVMRPLVFSLILSRKIPIKDAIALILRRCNAPDMDGIGRHDLHRVPVEYFHSW